MRNYIKDRISILAPVYNGAAHLDYFFSAVKAQKYNDYELVVVNDGSTDNTAEILRSYKEQFEAQGKSFVYLEQENKGVAAAVNLALKNFTGEFLTWIDSDDIIQPDFLSAQKAALDEHPECMFSMATKTNSVSEGDLQKIKNSFERKINRENDSLFDDVVFGNNIKYALVHFVVRAAFFERVFPEMRIYENCGGQNWQLALPLIYHGKWVYVDELLYTVVNRKTSHSAENTFVKDDEHEKKYKEILTVVLKNLLTADEWKEYSARLQQHYDLKFLRNAYIWNVRKVFLSRYKDYVRAYGKTREINNYKIIMSIPFGKKIYTAFKRFF